MPTLDRTHPDRRRARPGRTSRRRDIPAVPDPPLPDRRREPMGTFLGRVSPDDLVGSFGNVPHLRREGAGTFAGDPDRQRKGSFGDHDLELPRSLARTDDVT